MQKITFGIKYVLGKSVMTGGYLICYSLIFILLFGYGLNAQSVANYSVSRTTGITYNSIASTGNSFASWRYNGFYSQDDNRSDFTDIGFDFWYDGTRYTQFCVSTNGFIDFSSSTDDGGPQADDFGYWNGAFTQSNINQATRPAIAPFYDDMTAQGGTEALGNSLKYLVTGSAPNRVLTVEWINMAVYGNTSPNLNFQVKLYESSGIIETVYGTMTQGTHSFSYTCGINAPTMNGTPQVSQLLTQQTENTTSFSNTVQNNLTTMPSNNSMLTFMPPVPASPSGTLTFSSITSTGMTLQWTDWATNEISYAIYCSTDDINYIFCTEVPANNSTAVLSGLLPGTLYYFRVYAVTEGALSVALTGTQATNGAGTKISISTGNWNTAGIWSPSGVPTAGDNVTIADGHIVTVNNNITCNRLTIGQGTSGTLTIGNNNTARTLTVNNDITINSGAAFNVNTSSNTSHTLIAKGNIINNGTINFATDGNSLCNVTFNKAGNQVLSGTGSTNNYNLITVDLSSSVYTFEILSTNFSAANDFLTLTNGKLKLSPSGTVNITPFTASTNIASSTCITINGANTTVNTSAGIVLYGIVEVTAGTLNIGNAANENIQSKGGLLKINGGTVNIAGNYYSSGINDLVNFEMSSGALNLAVNGSSSTTYAPFDINSSGSSFVMAGGTITIVREGGSGSQNLGYTNTGSTIYTVTGGTLQIGNASTPASQIMEINTNIPIPSLLINSNNAPRAQLLTNPLSVINGITINSGATLDANNLNITLGGNWLNNGGTYIPGTNTTTFNRSGAQSITKSTGETFNNLTIAGSGTKTLGGNITLNGNLTISSILDVSTTPYNITLSRNWINNGSFISRTGMVNFNGTIAQTISGSVINSFYDLTIDNVSGVAISSGIDSVKRMLYLRNGVFNVSGATSFVMVSNASGTAQINAGMGIGTITGNVTVQRYISGAAGYRYMAAPVTGKTYTDWTDDFPVYGYNVPYGYSTSYYVNEAKPGVSDSGWTSIPSSSYAITPGRGFANYIYNDNLPLVVDVTGPVDLNNINFNITYNNLLNILHDGWNLVGNPYPSVLDWSNASGWTKTNMDDAVYIWRPDIQQYASYVNNVGTNGGTQYIAPSQAFFVKANTLSPSLIVNRNATSISNAVFFKTTEEEIDQKLRIILDNGADETYICLNNNATELFDDAYDAYKIKSTVPGIPMLATINSEALKFSINSVNIDSTISIPVLLSVASNSNRTFHIKGIEKFSNNICVMLEDLELDSVIDLRTDSIYSFMMNPDTLPRFIIHFTKISSSFSLTSNQIYLGDTIITYNQSSGNISYSWDFGDGTPVVESFEPMHQYTKPGEYEISLIAGNGSCEDVFKQHVMVVDTSSDTTNLNWIRNSEKDIFNIYPNPVKKEINIIASLPIEIKQIIISNVLGQKIYESNITQLPISINLSSFKSGLYFLKIIDVTGDEEIKRFVKE